MEDLSRIFSLLAELKYAHSTSGGIFIAFALILVTATISYIIYKVAVASLKMLSIGAAIYFVLLLVSPPNTESQSVSSYDTRQENKLEQFKAQLSEIMQQSKPLLNRILDIKSKTLS